MLRHYLRKGHRPRILQADIAEGKVQHHIVISGVLILFQNGSDFLFNGFQIPHCFLHKWKRGGSFAAPVPKVSWVTYSSYFGYSAIPPHPQ